MKPGLRQLLALTVCVQPFGSVPGSAAAGAAAAGQAGAELLDYLVQDVCVDPRGAIVAGDPATCPGHRDLRLGEAAPYLATDRDTANRGATYFAFSSFPVKGSDGAVRIMHAKSGQGGFGPDFTFSFDPARDGYDLTDISASRWASFVRTSDGGCFDQIWSANGKAQTMADRAGGWVLFPLAPDPSAWPAVSSARTRTYHVQLTPKAGCGNGNSPGLTMWRAPRTYTFESGKQLRAIRSDHFAHYSLGRRNNALERFYFTREYGLSRWEAWQPLSRCVKERGAGASICNPQGAPDHMLRGRCAVMNPENGAVPGLERWGGQVWVRIDCRDLTNHVPINKPQRLLAAGMARGAGHDDIAD